MSECKAKEFTLAQAVDKIVRHERLSTCGEDYLGKYDIALSVIFGIDSYKGTGACVKRAKELKRRVAK